MIYLTASRPDIQFNIGMCVRYQSVPKESHAETVKRIFRYLADTEELGIWYPKGGNEYLVAYSDSIMLDTKPTGIELMANVNSLVALLFLDLARTKPPCQYHQLKLSILLSQVVVLK